MPCRNRYCRLLRVDGTHSWEHCGAPGGPNHENYIAMKSEQGPFPRNDARSLSLTMFIKVGVLLGRNKSAMYKRIMQEFPGWSRSIYWTTAKVVGMFQEAGPEGLEEIATLTASGNKSMLRERIREAIQLVYYHELGQANQSQRIAAYNKYLLGQEVKTAVETLDLIADLARDQDWLLCH